MVTAETITDAEISGLRAARAIDFATFQTALLPYADRWARRLARARCAEILNARKANP